MVINLDNLDENTRNKLQSLSNLSQSLELITSQKIQLETTLRETEIAIEELEKLNPDEIVYKSIGGILVKSDRNKLLDEKKSLKVSLEMKIKTLKQKEDRTKQQLEALRKSIQADLQK
ncbi:MAG: prefoldin subunit beta [Promethearchaeota archaeon]